MFTHTIYTRRRLRRHYEDKALERESNIEINSMARMNA